MKKIELPESIKIEKEEWSGVRVIREGVLTLPFWKEASDLKLVNSCLSIDSALDADEFVISDDSHSHLSRAMAGAVIPNPVMNRFYMKCFSAVLKAVDCESP